MVSRVLWGFEGDASGGIYFIREGVVQITVGSSDDQELVLAVLSLLFFVFYPYT